MGVLVLEFDGEALGPKDGLHNQDLSADASHLRKASPTWIAFAENWV
jgi:hypothetical protein